MESKSPASACYMIVSLWYYTIKRPRLLYLALHCKCLAQSPRGKRYSSDYWINRWVKLVPAQWHFHHLITPLWVRAHKAWSKKEENTKMTLIGWESKETEFENKTSMQESWELLRFEWEMSPLKFLYVNTWSLVGSAVWEASGTFRRWSLRGGRTSLRYLWAWSMCAFSSSDSCVWLKYYQSASCLPGRPWLPCSP